MNDDKKLSEIEEQLKEGFRDAFDEYLKKKGETIPEPDFSFLNEPKEKTFHRITDGFFSTDENESAETSENEISITIDSMDDIDDAIAFMPDLPVPEYIPEGFELDELKVSKYMNETYSVKYMFHNNGKSTFIINSRYSKEEDNDIGLVGNSTEIKMNDRILYLTEDNYTSEYSLFFLLSNQFISVTGNLDNNSMLEVAQEIHIYQ